MAPRYCEAIDCRSIILPFALFCDRCWPLVPSDVKRIIERHHRPSNKHRSGVLQRALDQAVQELLSLKTQGHYLPRNGAFEWDDAPAALNEEQPSLIECGPERASEAPPARQDAPGHASGERRAL